MKRSTKAAALSFFVPGAGLWYLGKPLHAVMNLLVAAILTTLALVSGHEHLHYAILAIAAGSAGYAHAAERTSEQPPGTGSSQSPSEPNPSVGGKC